MSDLNLTIDFTGINAATGVGIGYLDTGYHTAILSSFKVYGEGEAQRLYCYMTTEGTTHRESFDLAKSKAQIKGMLVSAGIDERKLAGSTTIPFGKTIGKTVRFYYTAPNLGSDGKPVKGSWPRYAWLTQAQFDAALAQSGAAPASKPAGADLDLEDEAPAKTSAPVTTVKEEAPAPKAEKPAPKQTKAADDDFGFLSDDE